MRYLLDTNTISEAIKKSNGKIARKLFRLKPGSFAISAVVACELEYGLEKRPSERLSRQVRQTLKSIRVLDFPSAAASNYGAIRAYLEGIGKPISGNDMLIAAHAIHANLTLVSDNVKEFERVPGLKLENWLRE